MSETRFHKIYCKILWRTSNTKLKHYGNRGIKCLWKSFLDFKKDMYESYLAHVDKFGEKDTSIDRIDVNGDYSLDNCRWATYKEQADNRTNNILFDYLGKTMNLKQWAEYFGKNYHTLYSRVITGGWDFERAIFTEPRKIKGINY